MIEIFILSGLSLSPPVDTKTDFNLNNFIATLSLISIASVKKIRSQMSSNLISTPLDECHRPSELCGLDVTIFERYEWSVARQLTSSTKSLESQESYLTFFACTVLSHASIMLPPRQPRVFSLVWLVGNNNILLCHGGKECVRKQQP